MQRHTSRQTHRPATTRIPSATGTIRANSSAARITGTEAALIALLLIAFCARIWGMGIVTTDDAMWALWAHDPTQSPVTDFAVGQGRLWAFGGGAWLLLGLRAAGTVAGDALIVGSFVLFFGLFCRTVAEYWSGPVASLAAALFLATFALRADRTILLAYPLFFWMPASAIAGSLLALRRYQHRGGGAALALAAVLAAIGLVNNEGASLLALIVLAAAVAANRRRPAPEATAGARARRTRVAGAALASVGLVFVAASLLFRVLHPSHYAGNTPAPFHPARIAWALFNFATSGTVLYDLVHPYTLLYGDALAGTDGRITYAPLGFLPAAVQDAGSLTTGALVAALIAVAGRRAVDGGPDAAPGRTLSARGALAGLAAGLALATVPLLPVAMTRQYQDWFLRYDEHAYSHTVFASFGLALAVAAPLRDAVPRGARAAALAALAVALGFLGMLGGSMNDAIARDMRMEAGRWRVLRDLVEIADATASPAATMLVPRLRSGTWFAGVDPRYWSRYAHEVLHSALRITDHGLTEAEIADGAAFADYTLDPGGHGFTVVAAHLAPSSAADPVADRIAVLLELAPDPALLSRILSYTDRHLGARQVRLDSLKRIAPRVWLLDGVAADPVSIRILPAPVATRLRLDCGAVPPVGRWLEFGDGAPPGLGCFAGVYLDAGWGQTEPTGTWTLGPRATLTLPVAGLPPGDLRLQVDASSYTGLGFVDRAQDVRVSINGRPDVTWHFTPRSPAVPAPLVIAASDRRSDGVTITFTIDPPLTPRALGLSDDSRDLGLFLRGMVIRAAP